MEKLFRQVGDEVIEYTDDEYVQARLDGVEEKRIDQENAARDAKKAELLAKLGITAEEAKLLVS